MSRSLELQQFCRSEFEREATQGFFTLRRVPSSRVCMLLNYYEALNEQDKESHAEAAAMWTAMHLGGPDVEIHARLQENEAWKRWAQWSVMNGWRFPSIERLRDRNRLAAQDRANGQSHEVPRQIKDFTVSAVRAEELRKRVKVSFGELFSAKSINRGGGVWTYEGHLKDSALAVTINYAAHQLVYEINIESSSSHCKLDRIGFETTLGVNEGSWDFIVRENVDDSIRLLSDFVTYAAELPSRLPAGCFAASTV